MIKIREIADLELKTRVTLSIMNALPDWFSPPEDIIHKSRVHRDFPFFVAYDENRAIGFLALKIHNEYTADVYTLGVLKEYHRQGIGRQLIDACTSYCRSKGFQFLTVKTLDESASYEPYNGTRYFYLSQGFVPLEVFTTIWNEENPCLFLAKVL